MYPMITLCFANQKGGTGKTTATLALGAILAARRRVLLVDLDPQSSLTQALGIDATGRSLAEVLGANKPGKLKIADIVQTIRPGLDLAPADIALSVSESGLMTRYGREYVLRAALEGLPYDLALIDCPPSLAILTVNAIGAAHAAVILTKPAMMDLRGVMMFLQTLEEVKPINPAIQTLGVIVNEYDQRKTNHRDALQALEAAGLPILGTVPASVRVAESAAALVPLPEYDPAGKPTEAYKLIAERITQCLKDLK